MNLADAIRKAALSSGAPLGQPELGQPELGQPGQAQPAQAVFSEPAQVEATPAPTSSKPSISEEPTLAKEQEMKSLEGSAGDPPALQSEAPTGHNVVRLELVLNPEQLKGFFGAVIASQHSVLTLREAASYLRVSQSSLERMADDGDVPGMMVDGKWRFTRPALEDWLSAHPKKKEA